jgi:hypothetical protein
MSKACWALVVSVVTLAAVAAGGCSSSGSAEGSGESLASTSSALTANDQAAYDYFIGKGLTSFQAAGIIGNLDQESGMDPTISQYGGGPGRGIAQWSAGGRWDTDSNDNVLWYAGMQGASPYSLTLQLEFIWYELTTFSGYGLSELRSSTNVTDATIAFETYYEGCGECDQSTRISYAETALAAYGSMTAAPPSYGASFVGQSFPLASTTLTVFAGQTIPSYIELKNTGAATWDSSTHLGTTQPRDRTSVFADSTWLSPNRPSGVSGTVAPGATYKFTFDLHAPATPGNYLEYFNVVQEGVAWFSDPGQGGPSDNDLEANITVVAGVRGSLDAAACDAIAGWTQDQASPGAKTTVTLDFDAPAGATGAESMSVQAGNSRSDLCTAIGSCDHGFSVPVPAAVRDGKSHTVYAYGVSSGGGGPTVLLPGSPKTFTCSSDAPPYAAQTGIKRHVIDPTSFSAWGFTALEIAAEGAPDLAAYPTGAPFPSTPTVVIATGAPEVWVIDGSQRRHVVDPTSLAAWGLSVTTWTAAEVDKYGEGPDWPEVPFLAQASGDPAVYIIDVSPGTPAVDAGAFDAGHHEAADAAVAHHHGRDAGRAPVGEVIDGGFSGSPDAVAAAIDASETDAGVGVAAAGGCNVTRGAGSATRASDVASLALGLAALLVRRRRR